MNAVTVLTALLAVVFASLGLAKLLAVTSMRRRATHVGFSVDAYRWIGALEVAGAVGLTVRALSPLIATAAAVGLLLLLIGAAAAHLRVKDLRGATPALVLGCVLAAVLTLTVGNP